ncbi:MAG: zinc-binding dehydrogenase [Oscillospiraceae bacterium]|nr:zinc-binding dehydrogenase [Oscillospiraceae bacterium]
MKTRALRLYGKNDLRVEEFDLPKLKDDEILALVVSDSLCMSSYKALIQGGEHKRVPEDIAQRPIILGHEFCGKLIEVGSKWADQFHAGQMFSIQPALNYKGLPNSLGYSYPCVGGDATYVILPNEVMEMGCLLPYEGEGYFGASLAEPYSCVIGTFHAMYHTTPGKYEHLMGVRPGGKMAILAGAGPMGLAAVDYIIHATPRPSKLIITDIDQARLDRATELITPAAAKKLGVELCWLNTANVADPKAALMDFADGTGFDDVIVFAPVKPVVELGDSILGKDGCLNFFSGPSDPNFSALFNFYNVHYAGTHIVGTSGGNTDDLAEALEMMGRGELTPAFLVTHIGGLAAAKEATENLPKLSGGKKLIYTGFDMPLTAITDFGELGKTDPLFAELDALCKKNNGLWNAEAEKLLLKAKGCEV